MADFQKLKNVGSEFFNFKEFGKRDEVGILAQGLLQFLVVFNPGSVKDIVEVFGIGAILFGFALIFLGGIDLGESLTSVPEPRSENQLKTSGTFALCRHPQ